ncbi:hypothetical protein ACVK00_004925 [Burkholderia sp. PvR073]|uniref:hypothetical protein n=1 Tax=Burkholderia TaxID=32008 RepID=UPI00254D241B|nr:hypothetical protein [Burkholderia sp. lyk4-R2A-23]
MAFSLELERCEPAVFQADVRTEQSSQDRRDSITACEAGEFHANEMPANAGSARHALIGRRTGVVAASAGCLRACRVLPIRVGEGSRIDIPLRLLDVKPTAVHVASAPSIPIRPSRYIRHAIVDSLCLAPSRFCTRR